MRASKETPDDENDWDMVYPSPIVGWLVDVEESFNWRLSPAHILETERLYPGLIGDMSIEVWQRRLIAEQIKTDTPDGA